MQQSQEPIQPRGDALSPASNSGTRPSLVAGISIGNPQAWERLVACYQPRLITLCRSKGLDDAATNDVLQEVWIAVARSLPKFSSTLGKGAFRAWLWRIAQRRILDYRRQEMRGPAGTGGSTMLGRLAILPIELGSTSSEFTQVRSSLKLNIKVQNILDRISLDYEPRTWQAFLRTAMDGCATDQVALEFGMTAVGVRQIRSRILRRIRTELGQ